MKQKHIIIYILIALVIALAYADYTLKTPYDQFDTSTTWTSMTGSYIKGAESGDFNVTPEKMQELKQYIHLCSFQRISSKANVYGEPEDAHISVVFANGHDTLEIYIFGSNLIRLTYNNKVSKWKVKTKDFERNVFDIMLE